jgi:hypothetical protein
VKSLTADEKGTIRTVKKKINTVVIEESRSLTKQIKEEMKGRRGIRSDRVRMLEKQRDSLKPITGDPVHLKVEGCSILIDYQVVRRAMRLTERFQRDVRIQESTLIIEYRGQKTVGTMELHRLPRWEEELLNLPLIDLKEGEQK